MEEDKDKKPKFVNLYRVQLNHPTMDGKIYNLYAESEDAMRTIAMINAPPGTYIERIVPLQSGVKRPPQNEEETISW